VVTYVLPALPLEVAAEVVAREFEDTCALTWPVNRIVSKVNAAVRWLMSTSKATIINQQSTIIGLAAGDLASLTYGASIKLPSRRGTFD